MKVTIALLLVGASIASVHGEGGLRQAAEQKSSPDPGCPTLLDIITWGFRCINRLHSNKEVIACMGCSNITPQFDSCKETMGDPSTPLNELISQYCK